MPRVLIPVDVQKKLCLSAKDTVGKDWVTLARYLQVPKSTLYNWSRALRLLPLDVYEKLIELSEFSIGDFNLLPDNWGFVKGGKIKKSHHGRSFWTLEGSIKGGTNSAKKFTLPNYSEKLAELVGIMLGDGGITRTQISITLGYPMDKEYLPFVTNLLNDIFSVKTSIYYSPTKRMARVRASGVNLVKNLLKIGLVQGDKIKQQMDIPAWISDDRIFIQACIRGLIDTDGCVHRKARRSKDGGEYRSIGITFSSHSLPLQKSVISLFNILGFKAAISSSTIYLCGKEQIERYVKEIGFSNPKHLKRYREFKICYGWIKANSDKLFYVST
jgi:intein/homing endonuclease